MPPTVRHSEVVYRGRAFSVRVDEVEIKPGVISRLDIVDHPNAVTILLKWWGIALVLGHQLR